MTRIVLIVVGLLVAFFVISAFVHILIFWGVLLLLVAVFGFSFFKIGRFSGRRSQRE